MPAPLDTLLLPGLDGTGLLFKSFIDACPSSLAPKAISYPRAAPLGYAELEVTLRMTLPSDRPFALIAESFSGPLALRIAARRPAGLVAIALVGTFVRPSVRWLRPWVAPFIGGYLFRAPPPGWIIRHFAAGRNASEAFVADVAKATRLVRPDVLARRVRDVLRVDAVADLLAVQVPMLYLGGSKDRLLRQGLADELKRLRPDLETATIEAPHFILQTRPTEAAALIADFFRRRRAE
jgi:pimeloyl-[acyl-carrier protein] methyl ester esterase